MLQNHFLNFQDGFSGEIKGLSDGQISNIGAGIESGANIEGLGQADTKKSLATVEIDEKMKKDGNGANIKGLGGLKGGNVNVNDAGAGTSNAVSKGFMLFF